MLYWFKKKDFCFYFQGFGSNEKGMEHESVGDACCGTCGENMETLSLGTEVHNHHKSTSIETLVRAKDCYPKTTKVYDKAS